jgi:hypothetical protein
VAGVAPGISTIAPISFSLPNGNVRALGSADLNGDGFLDLVVGWVEPPYGPGGSQGFGVMFSLADGGFSDLVGYDGPGYGPMAFGDLNGDGAYDVVLVGVVPQSDPPQSIIEVFMNLGDGRLGAPLSYGPSPAASSYNTLNIGDFNGDGAPDLLMGINGASPTIEILYNQGDGTFGQGVLLPPIWSANANYWDSTAVQDLNGDGLPDIVGAFMNGPVVVLLNEGDGEFALVQLATVDGGPDAFVSVGVIPAANTLPARIVVSDVPYDSTRAAQQSLVQVFEFEDGAVVGSTAYPTSTSGTSITTGDLNADCVPDILVYGFCFYCAGGPVVGGVEIIYGLPDGGFTPPEALAPAVKFPYGVTLVGSTPNPHALAILDGTGFIYGAPPSYDAGIVVVGSPRR